MAVARVTADSKIWFVTSLDAAAVSRIINRPQTCVVMQNRRAWLSLSGTADVVHDRAQIKELWQDAWKVWFPAGRTDPSSTLIHFAAHEGEYWDASGFAGRRFQFPTGNPCPAETAPRTQTSRHQQAADYSYRR
jgi:general stress protein 26